MLSQVPSRRELEQLIDLAGSIVANLETAVAIVVGAAGAAGDQETEDHRKAVETTYVRLTDGRTATGGRAAGDVFDAAVRSRFCEWMGFDEWQSRTPRGAQAGFRLTDYGNAERLVHQHGEDVRYCHA